MARKKTPESPPIEIKQFTAQEIERGVTKLRRRMNEVGDMDADRAARPESSETHVVASNIAKRYARFSVQTHRSFGSTNT